ncbi:MAG TPA: HAMP domain-containing sensor histidine kinase [Burkholderiaceae bacterium]|jgi:signal transduction histidine kinase
MHNVIPRSKPSSRPTGAAIAFALQSHSARGRGIVATMSNQLGDAAIACEQDIVEGITMDSYPGSPGQVIMNFINKSLVHAFEGGGPGQVTLMAQPNDADRVGISFSDNGAGIPPEILAKLFDPFFTTKLGQGESGLGLSVCYNLVKSILDGNISVVSELQRGTTLMIDLPLVAAKRNQS